MLYLDLLGSSFAGGAPAAYIGHGTCTSVHFDTSDAPITSPATKPARDRSPGCTVFLKVPYDGSMTSVVLEAIDSVSTLFHADRIPGAKKRQREH